MKNLFLVVIMIFCVSFSYSQSEVREVSNSKYKLIEKSEFGEQMGFLKLDESGEMVRHGIWVLRKDGKIINKALYRDDELQWIQIEDGTMYSKEEIQIERLKKRIFELEESITSNR